MKRILGVIVFVVGLAATGAPAQESVGTPMDDLDIVREEGMRIVEKMLEKDRAVSPFVVAMARDGRTEVTYADPPNKYVLQRMLDRLREDAPGGELRAVAHFLSIEKRLPMKKKKERMLRIGLEQSTGRCIDWLIPFKKKAKLDRDRVLLVLEAEGRIFSACD